MSPALFASQKSEKTEAADSWVFFSGNKPQSACRTSQLPPDNQDGETVGESLPQPLYKHKMLFTRHREEGGMKEIWI